MWFPTKNKIRPLICLVADNTTAALALVRVQPTIEQPFAFTAYRELPAHYFLHGMPWNLAGIAHELRTMITDYHLEKPLLSCASGGDVVYDTIITHKHGPTQAAIPADKQYQRYAWHATTLPCDQKEEQRFLISGIPHEGLLRYQLLAHATGCNLQRATTLRASTFALHRYQQNNLACADTSDFQMTNELCTKLCTLPAAHAQTHLPTAALGLFIHERVLS